MTDTTTATRRLPVAGETAHALVSGVMIHLGGQTLFSGRTVELQRGQNFTITDAIIDAHRDRHGSFENSLIALIHDPDEQIRRYGEVRLAPGDAPVDIKPWIQGDPTWERERDTARRRAYALPSERERVEALAAVEREYGAAPTTSQTTRTIIPGTHPTERAQQAQAERHRHGIVNGSR